MREIFLSSTDGVWGLCMGIASLIIGIAMSDDNQMFDDLIMTLVMRCEHRSS